MCRHVGNVRLTVTQYKLCMGRIFLRKFRSTEMCVAINEREKERESERERSRTHKIYTMHVDEYVLLLKQCEVEPDLDLNINLQLKSILEKAIPDEFSLKNLFTKEDSPRID